MDHPPVMRVSAVAQACGQHTDDVHEFLITHHLSSPQWGDKFEGFFAETYIAMHAPVGEEIFEAELVDDNE